MGRHERLMDLPYKSNGFWIKIARKFKPNDECIRWNFWMCYWEVLTITKIIPDMNEVELRINDNFSNTEGFHRLRPMWFKFHPSYWIWRKR